MVGESETELTEAILNRRPGQIVFYSDNSDNSDGGHLITITSNSTNYASTHRDLYPWELRLALLEELVRDTIALFGRFATGWIPAKGFGGLQFAPTAPETTNAPAPVDRRRDIRVIMTVRPVRVP